MPEQIDSKAFNEKLQSAEESAPKTAKVTPYRPSRLLIALAALGISIGSTACTSDREKEQLAREELSEILSKQHESEVKRIAKEALIKELLTTPSKGNEILKLLDEDKFDTRDVTQEARQIVGKTLHYGGSASYKKSEIKTLRHIFALMEKMELEPVQWEEDFEKGSVLRIGTSELERYRKYRAHEDYMIMLRYRGESAISLLKPFAALEKYRPEDNRTKKYGVENVPLVMDPESYFGEFQKSYTVSEDLMIPEADEDIIAELEKYGVKLPNTPGYRENYLSIARKLFSRVKYAKELVENSPNSHEIPDYTDEVGRVFAESFEIIAQETMEAIKRGEALNEKAYEQFVEFTKAAMQFNLRTGNQVKAEAIDELWKALPSTIKEGWVAKVKSDYKEASYPPFHEEDFEKRKRFLANYSTALQYCFGDDDKFSELYSLKMQFDNESASNYFEEAERELGRLENDCSGNFNVCLETYTLNRYINPHLNWSDSFQVYADKHLGGYWSPLATKVRRQQMRQEGKDRLRNDRKEKPQRVVEIQTKYQDDFSKRVARLESIIKELQTIPGVDNARIKRIQTRLQGWTRKTNSI